MQISILGTGCAKCTKLHENTLAALSELGVQADVEKVTEIQKIMGFGIMMTPALAVDGEVKAVGKVLSVGELKALLG